MTDQFNLPQFSKIETNAIVPELKTHLDKNRETIKNILSQKNFTWQNAIAVMEDMDVMLSNFWSPISHMNSVVNTDELRAVYDQSLPLLTEYSTEVGLNKDLYNAYLAIFESESFKNLNQAQQKVITDALRDFKLAGVALEGEAKERYQQIQLKLSELSNQFEKNVMDSTDAWSKEIEDESLLKGIPQATKNLFKQKAEEQNKKGWLITLDFPSYYSVVTYAENRELRKELYTAFCTRASEQGPHDKKFDNSSVMFEILKLRDEEAKLLDFNNFAEYSIAPKMASTPDEVLNFLTELAEKTKAMAIAEKDELRQFAKNKLNIDDFQAWDAAFASEKLKEEKHDISDEELKPYFEVNHVINGLFEIVHKLYGITIIESIQAIDTWHKDVRFYEIYDANKNVIAGFYLDLYARAKKRGGAWMDDCRVRHLDLQGHLQLPVAYLTCNFTPPVKDKPSLLTHDEVITLFHEFGHGLHHMLTKVDIASVSGINGVAWDAVEFPSQFMENWCWQKESLNLIALHHETKEPLPKDLYDRLIASKNFQAGMQMLRQLEFAIFDFRIHKDFSGHDEIQKTLDEVRHRFAVLQPPEFNRFQHGFSHIFAGGYAAGYYSYKWAEVLAADAFSLFEKAGVFDPILGERFLTCVLQQGGSKEAMDIFKSFQGREPQVDALLRDNGII